MWRRVAALVASACLTVAPLAASLTVFAAPAAEAADTASCSCADATGSFVKPATGTLVSGQATSAGNYTAEWHTDGTVTVKDGSTTVMSVIGTIGGFSKDQSAFVVESKTSDHVTVVLYNLDSSTPATPIWQANEAMTSSALIFSPSGKYLEFGWTTGNVTHFQIADASATTMKSSLTTLDATSAAPPGSGNQVMGTVSAGWGPNDRVFAVGTLATAGVSWYWVDLTSASRPVLSELNIQASSSYVEFTPCGEDLAIVSSANGVSVNINLFNGATGAADGSASSIPIGGGLTLTATAASYVAVVGGTDAGHTYVLADNGCSTDTGGGDDGGGDDGGGDDGGGDDGGGGSSSPPQTGDFVVPAGGTKISGRVTSAGDWTATWNPDNTVTLEEAGTIKATVPGTVGGFGPGQKAFVAETMTGGVTSVNLYNLDSSPGTSIFSAGATVTSDALIFSPKGNYFLYGHTTTGNVTHLQIADAKATTPKSAVWDFDVTSSGPPGTGSATIKDVGTVRYGWSPGEKNFAVGALSSSGQAVWSWTDLSAAHPATRSSGNLVAVSSYVAYCPCGNSIAIVTAAADDHASVFLDDASTGAALGSATNVAADNQPIGLAATEESFEALIGGTDADHTHVLAPNTCPTGGSSGGDDGGGGDGGGTGSTDGTPTASFTAPDLLLAGLELSFTDTSTDSLGTIVDWAWDFGDGTTIRKQNPTHTYVDPGTYVVSLTVTDSGPASHTDTTTTSLVVVPDKPPVASFTYAPDLVSHGDTVTFTDTSTDPDDGVATRQWHDEATGKSGSGSTFRIQICSLTTVELTVTDHAGKSDDTETDLGADVTQTYPVPAGASLKDALANPKLCPGDTLQLAAGTYAGGVKDDMVNIAGAGPGKTIITGNTGNPDCSLCAVLDLENQQQIVDSMSISQVTVRDSVGTGTWNGSGWGINLDAGGSVAEVGLDHVELTNNDRGGATIASDWSGGLDVSHSTIHDNGGAGIDLEVDRSYLQVSDTEINANAGSGIQTGERANNSSVTVTDSHLHDNAGTDDAGGGLHLNGAEVNLTSNEIDANAGGILFGESVHGTVSGNDVHDNTGSGLVTSDAREIDVVDNRFVANHGEGVNIMGLDGSLTFAGNLVARNSGIGVHYGSTSGNVPTLTVADNTIADNDGLGVSGSGTDLVLANNILSGDNTGGDGTAADELDPDSVVCGLKSNLVGTDPKFIEPGDYHLAPDSPAIDAGDDDSVPSVLATDADGDPRIAGAAVDVGYDETAGTAGHGGSGTPTTGCDARFHSETSGQLDPGASGSTTDAPPSTDVPLTANVQAPSSLLPSMSPGDRFSYSTTVDQRPYDTVPPLERWRVGLYGYPPGTAGAPFTITFGIDASLLGPAKAADVVVNEEGELLPACVDPDPTDSTPAPTCASGPVVVPDCASPYSADPDPCVSGREDIGDGDARITVLAAHPFDLKDATSNPHAGPATWTFATPHVAATATTVSLVADQSDVTTGAPVQYTATVSPAVDGGTVTFSNSDGNPIVGCDAVAVDADSTAICQTSYDTVGAPTVTALYNGDDVFAASGPSAAVPVTVTSGSSGTPPLIYFPAPPEMTYGDAPAILTAMNSIGEPVQFAASPAGVCSVAGNTLTVVGVGDCSVTASGLGAEPVTHTVHVGRADLTITAGDASMVAGGDLPTVSPSYDGFVAGETADDLDRQPVCKADVATASTSCSGAASANYQITYVNGTLHISDSGDDSTPTGSVGTASVGAGGSETVSANGFADGEDVEADLHSAVIKLGVFHATASGALTFTFTIPASIAPGRHHVVLTGLTSGRTVSIPLTVTPRTGSSPVTDGGGILPDTGNPAPVVWLFAALAALAGGLALMQWPSECTATHRAGRHRGR